MMSMPIDPAQMKALYDAGYISDDTYARANAPTVANAPAPTPQEIASGINTLGTPPQSITPSGELLVDEKESARQLKKFEDERRANILRAFQQEGANEGAQLAEQEKEKEKAKLAMGMLAGDQPAATAYEVATPGLDLQQMAIAQGAAAGMAKAAETTSELEITNKKIAEMREADAQKAAAAQQELIEKESELESEIERVQSLKVDPGNFWASATTENKVLMGISLALGAFGAAGGGGNRAAQVINQAIDRDIKMQQANIAQETRGLDRSRGLLAQMRSRFRNEAVSREAARAAYLADAQMRIQTIASKYQSPELQANAQNLIGQIETQKQAAKQAAMAEMQKRMPIDKNVMPMDKDARDRFVYGYGLAQKASYADKLNTEIIPETKSINDSVDALRDMADGTFQYLSPDKTAEALVHAKILVGKLRLPITGPGAMNESEQKLLDELIANPTKIFSLDRSNRIKLDTLKKKINYDFNQKLRQFGIEVPEDKLDFKKIEE